MKLRTLYHKCRENARGAAEFLTAAGAVALAGAAVASACMMVGAAPGENRTEDRTRIRAAAAVMAAKPEPETVDVIRYGAPYTTEYDYSLETEQEPEQIEEVESEPEESAGAMLRAEQEPEPESEPEPEPEPEPEESVPVGAWTETDEVYARMIAQVLWGECRGCSATEQAAVAWCVLNRVDSPERYFPDDVAAVIGQPFQFLGYAPDNPVTDELYKVARDVLSRWYAERAGAADVGRVLPREYCFFWGDGRHNYFTEVWRGADVWDWSLGNPYGE